MWVTAKNYLQRIDIRTLRPFSHLKGTLILFLPTIAVSIYTVLDKTLIGMLIPGTYEAFDNEEKIKSKANKGALLKYAEYIPLFFQMLKDTFTKKYFYKL